MGARLTDAPSGWQDADSRAFVDRAAIFVPSRDEQHDALCSLIPAGAVEAFTVVELGAGDGTLARTVLGRFPRCRYVALDGSAVMRERLTATLGSRAEVRAFDLAGREWPDTLPRPLRAVLASLVVHHLDADGKRRLFEDLARRLEPGGALLLADIVEPSDACAKALFARQWSDAARAQSLALTGSLDAFSEFDADGWNFYADTAPDLYDQPSRLSDQLAWLREAGFSRVDCWWLRAGHAIYGGYV